MRPRAQSPMNTEATPCHRRQLGSSREGVTQQNEIQLPPETNLVLHLLDTTNTYALHHHTLLSSASLPLTSQCSFFNPSPNAAIQGNQAPQPGLPEPLAHSPDHTPSKDTYYCPDLHKRSLLSSCSQALWLQVLKNAQHSCHGIPGTP